MKKFKNRFTAVLLTAVMSIMFIPAASDTFAANVSEEDKTIACLGTEAIDNPVNGDTVTEWTGNYVYYGAYAEGDNTAKPVKYRVLANGTSDFGGRTMLLDCDSVLFSEKFYDESVSSEGGKENDWSKSYLKKSLNGNGFLEKEGVFTAVEKENISSSRKTERAYGDGTSAAEHMGYAALNNDKVFVLDVGEASNASYGYKSVNEASDTRLKYDEDTEEAWWVRSPFLSYDDYSAITDFDGKFAGFPVKLESGVCPSMGVSPAFNVDLSNVLFTSVVSGEAGTIGAEYKLTLLDNNLQIGLQNGKKASRNGNTITIPYAITNDSSNGISATQVSVLLTDKPYTNVEAKILDGGYMKLSIDSFSETGTGTFTLPDAYAEDILKGNYHIYIIAEDVNTDNNETADINEAAFTDYASEPYEIKISELEHVHDFSVSSNNYMAIVQCNADYCPYNKYNNTTTSYRVYIKIDVKDLNSTAAEAYIEKEDGFPDEITVGSIYYTGRGNTDYKKSTSVPVKAGEYTASADVSDGKTTVTISADYKLMETDSNTFSNQPTSASTSTGMINSADVYVAQVNPSIVVAMDAVKSDESDVLEYKWVACEESDPNVWFEISPWTKNNQYLSWQPDRAGDYIIVGYVRVVGNEDKSLKTVPFGVNYKMIKEICQMPYEDGGYLIGFESYDNPNQEYQYEMFVMDLSLLAAGSPTPWVHATGKITLAAGATPSDGKTMWTIWQPEYGYYLTLFRLYDKAGNIIDEVPYGFVNAY
ncbi:MAG: hypothetical protein IJ054_05765 [Lachnospiraceae bacterium]|nr:hypothetical protein [Lachnospiraceae bacterium]MBQ9232900.1 hypothetical protein [Lachnospiraceae bacterium]